MRFLVAVLLLVGTDARLWAGPVIKVGEVDPLSGSVSQFGIGCHRGILLALERINAVGGVLGREVQLVTEDDQSKAGQSAAAVRKLISQDKVVAILGDATSSSTLESAPIAQQAKIPMITPSATNLRVTEVGDFIFRVCLLDDFQGRVLARFAREKLKAQRIFMLTDVRQDYSVDLGRYFKAAFTDLGGAIAGQQSYLTGDTVFRSQLTSIRAALPDAIFVPGYYSEVALIVKQGRQIGLRVPFIGCGGWANQALVTVGGKAIDGCYFTNQFSPNDQAPVGKQFVTKYEAKYRSVPDAFGALAYDAASILCDAIRRAGAVGSQEIRDALAKTAGFEGVTGTISLDAKRNASKPLLIMTINQGKFDVVEKIAESKAE
jgi:branched-chain amino acid transport system substrate-binding protein